MRLITPVRFLLTPFSFIYFLIISLRNFFYNKHIFKIHSLDAKVISIGNITWGGSGKTPLVLSIAEELSKQGIKFAILTRGYGKDEEGLFKDLKVIVNKDRVKGAKDAITRYSVKTLLLDDGFQHRRLKRDLDIICIDAANPFGNGWVIPAGILREGLNSLKRADIFLITKADLIPDEGILETLEKKLKGINSKAVIVKSIHQAQHFYKLSDKRKIDLNELKNKDIVLVSAIGSPCSFEKTVLNLGLKVKRHFIFRDHYWYKEKDLKKIDIYCKKNNINTVITTEKDAVKLKAVSCQLSAISLLVLCIKLKVIENEKAFYSRLFGSHSG